MSFPQHIMVIESERNTRRFLSDILTQQQIETIEFVENPEDALIAVQKRYFDLILMDMDGKDKIEGVELAKKIMQYTPHPIVFLSADSDKAFLQRILELTPYGFLFKPFSPKDILISMQLAYTNFLNQYQPVQTTEAKNDESFIRINESYLYDMENRKLYHNDTLVKLTLRQERLIDCLCRNLDTTVTYESLSYAVWGENRSEGSVLRTLIYTIRKILPDFPIVSYSKIGYALQSEKI